MNNEEAKLLVKNVFKVIEEARNLEEINLLLDNEPLLSKNRINTLKYPKIEFTLSENDINYLKTNNFITNDNKLNLNSDELNSKDTLFKLLYSIIWKNGDLGKEKHVIEGILKFNKVDEKGIVFYHFGKFIGDIDKKEPIIDQHTLRAYGIYLEINGKVDEIFEKIPNKNKKIKKMNLEYYRKLSITSKKELPLIESYKNWIKQHKLYKHENFTYSLDLVLFALGKSIKS